MLRKLALVVALQFIATAARAETILLDCRNASYPSSNNSVGTKSNSATESNVPSLILNDDGTFSSKIISHEDALNLFGDHFSVSASVFSENVLHSVFKGIDHDAVFKVIYFNLKTKAVQMMGFGLIDEGIVGVVTVQCE